MTLLITAAARDIIYQSADFRLSDPDTGRVVADRSTKLVTLTYESWQGFVAYTGVGRVRATDTSATLVQWLAGKPGLSPNEVEELIQSEGSRWLSRISSRSPHRHTFLFGCFDHDGPRLSVISNFEDCRGRRDAQGAARLSISRVRSTSRPVVIVSGAASALQRPHIGRLRRILRANADDPARVRILLAEFNRLGATNGRLGATVSEACSVVSISSDGRGVNNISGQVEMRAVMNGMPLPTQAELEALVGFKLGSVVGGISSVVTQGLSRTPYPDCKAVQTDPTPRSHTLEEWTHPKLKSVRPVDVSESGIVLGVGQLAADLAGSVVFRGKFPGDIEISDFAAGYGGINSSGTVVTSATMSDGVTRAALWAPDVVSSLGAGEDHSSSAVAVNSYGLVVGSVSTEPDDMGRHKQRPAAWLPTGEFVRLDEFGCDYAHAVDVNDQGLVLVAGHTGMTTSALLWNPATSELCQVGDWIGVYPIALNDHGTVVGNAVGEDNKHVSLIAQIGGPWQRLVPFDGLYVNDINDSGDMAGTFQDSGFSWPWFWPVHGEAIRLPTLQHHSCRISAINNSRRIVGDAEADHGVHGLVWTPIG